MNNGTSGLLWPLVLIFLTFLVLGVLAIVDPTSLGRSVQWGWLIGGAFATAILLYWPRVQIWFLKFWKSPIPTQIAEVHKVVMDGVEPRLELIIRDISALTAQVSAIAALFNTGDVHTTLEGVSKELAADGHIRKTLDNISTELTDTGHLGKTLDNIIQQLAAIKTKLPP